MERIKRVAAIHDMSGVGKCSLTAAIPVLSCAGVECCPIPTAILSSHTGEMEGYSYTDLTSKIEEYYKHWKSLSLNIDCIYSGYLASAKQIDIVCNIIDTFSNCSPLVVVDPAMADAGKLYVGFDTKFVSDIKVLCSKADIIVPNITEASMLSGYEYKAEPYDKDYIIKLMKSLSTMTKRYVVLTGTSLTNDTNGCSVYDKAGNHIEFYTSPKYPGRYYGTGDLFASALTGAVLRGKDVFESAEIALDFTCKSIEETYLRKTDTRFGVFFEKFLPYYINLLGGNQK